MLENVLPAWEKRVEKRAKKEITNEIAKKMLEIGLTIEQIIKTTGLSQQDVLLLKDQKANASTPPA